MQTYINVPREFILKRNKHSKIYKANGRSKDRLLRDIECEFYEYNKLKTGEWKYDSRWQIDGVDPRYGNVDVKCIQRYYNLSRKKFIYLLKQRGITDAFYFIEWVKRPDRLIKTGDEIGFRFLGVIPYEQLINLVQVSFKSDGFYADVRRFLRK